MAQPLRVDDILQKAERGPELSEFEIYEPSKLQIANAARIKEAYPGRRRYKVNPELLIKALILLSLTFLVVKALTYFL